MMEILEANMVLDVIFFLVNIIITNSRNLYNHPP